jgi:hypothetical protein
MAELFFADLVRETSQGTGSGVLTLAGAVAGHRRFADVVPSGARFHYAIAGVTHPAQWETGEGQIVAGGALMRTPIASSAGGTAVDFLAGSKTVSLTVCSAWFAAQAGALAAKAELAGADFTGPLSAPALTLGAPLGLGDGGTGAASAAEARANLGLTIGVASPASIPSRGDADARYAALGHGHAIADVAGLQGALDAKQPADAELTALAGLASAADRLPYFSGAGTASLAVLSAFGRSLIDDADAPAARTTIGLGNAENKSSATIRGELSSANVTAALGFTPANKAGDAFGGGVSIAGVATLSGDNSFPGSVTGEAKIYRRSTTGLSMYGAGTTYDFALFNKNGGNVLVVPTGAQNIGLFGTVSIGSAQVLGARRTGWAAPTGTAARASFDTATATTAQLAERLKALIDDLIAHGLIGS